jgi:hypothetical protein
MDVTPQGLQDYADAVRATWVEWTDEDVAELATAAADALAALASRAGTKRRIELESLDGAFIDHASKLGDAVAKGYQVLLDLGFSGDEIDHVEAVGTVGSVFMWHLTAHNSKRSVVFPIRLH